jgi:hypothetical protein
MRLDASGNVGICSTSPGHKLDITGTLSVSKAITAGVNTPTISTSTFTTDASLANPFPYRLVEHVPVYDEQPDQSGDGQRIV